MKKVLLVFLTLLLFFNLAYAEQASFLDMVTTAGISAEEVVVDGEMFTQEAVDELTSHGKMIILSDTSIFQMVLWNEDGTPYGFAVVNFDGSADMEQGRKLFVQALETYQWEACSYSKQDDAGNSISYVFAPGFEDESDSQFFETQEEFLDAVKNEIG